LISIRRRFFSLGWSALVGTGQTAHATETVGALRLVREGQPDVLEATALAPGGLLLGHAVESA
jgi:hypothetical protein